MATLVLTIASGTVASDLTDFPVYVDLSDFPPEFWADVDVDGGDIRVSDGVDYLPIDVVYIDTTGQTGILFFKADLFSASDNVFNVEYDTGLTAPAASDPIGRYAMWSDFAVSYWPIGGNYNRVNDVAPTLVGTGPGFVGEYEEWDADGHKYWSGLPGSNIWTMSSKARAAFPGGNHDAVTAISSGSGDANRAGMLFRGTVQFGMWNSTSSWLSGGTPVAATNYVFHGAQNGATERKLLIDGGSTYSGTSGSANRNATVFVVASSNLDTTLERLAGEMLFASLRYSYIGNDQIAAEAANLNSPSTFYSVSSTTNEVARITQAPLLVVMSTRPPTKITQVPLLIVLEAIQGTRVTQAPILPVWTPTPIPLPLPVLPDTPVVETWQYKTVVNIAERGKEQRSALRGEPRFNMNFSATILDDEDRRDVYQMLFKYIKMVFNYPMYVYSTKLDEAALAGATKLYFNPAYTDLRDGEAMALFDPQLEQTTMVTVATVDADGATLTEPLADDVPAYFYVAPAPQFRTPPFVGLEMNAIDGTVSLRLEGAQSRQMLRPGQSSGLLTLVDGMLLLDKRPLANSSVKEDFDQNVMWLDNDVAPPEPRTRWFTPFISGDREFLVHRPNDLDYWRAVADNLKGRQNPFLLPTFRDDLPLASQPVLGATTVVSTNVQFADFWRSRAWRYVRLQSQAGVLYRRINEVVTNYDPDGQPVSVDIKLAESIGAEAGRNEDLVVSFVNTCRLDSDDISLNHGPTDSTIVLKTRLVEE